MSFLGLCFYNSPDMNSPQIYVIFFYFLTYSNKETSSDIININITTYSPSIIFFAVIHQILAIPQA